MGDDDGRAGSGGGRAWVRRPALTRSRRRKRADWRRRRPACLAGPAVAAAAGRLRRPQRQPQRSNDDGDVAAMRPFVAYFVVAVVDRRRR